MTERKIKIPCCPYCGFAIGNDPPHATTCAVGEKVAEMLNPPRQHTVNDLPCVQCGMQVRHADNCPTVRKMRDDYVARHALADSVLRPTIDKMIADGVLPDAPYTIDQGTVPPRELIPLNDFHQLAARNPGITFAITLEAERQRFRLDAQYGRYGFVHRGCEYVTLVDAGRRIDNPFVGAMEKLEADIAKYPPVGVQDDPDHPCLPSSINPPVDWRVRHLEHLARAGLITAEQRDLAKDAIRIAPAPSPEHLPNVPPMEET